MAEKARDAFRTISEVANWLDVPAHVLRFWESKFPQIKPVKRAGGRRYYRPADMELIGGIKKLLHDDGLTIRGVQKMIKEEGVKAISALSPPLNMPSEEEAAARRKARRARRQARQAARSRTGEPAERLEIPTPPAPPETEEEAPYTHVEDAEEVTDNDNVVQMPSREEEAAAATAAEEPIENSADILAQTPAPANVPLPEPPEPEATPELEGIGDDEPQGILRLDTPVEASEAEEPSTAQVEPEETGEETLASPPEASEPSTVAAEPTPESVAPTRPIVATEPFDLASISASDAQRIRVKRLRKFRRLDVGTVFASGSEEAIMRAQDRLQTLRDRLAIDLERR